MKVVINSCYGGFGVSKEGFEFLINKGWTVTHEPEVNDTDTDLVCWDGKNYGFSSKLSKQALRSHPDLVEMVETLGVKANDFGAKLEIKELPEYIWGIKEHDGYECLEYRSY